MFFDKPVHDLTFEDVVAFCKKQIPEGKQLDYKYVLPKNKEKFAKVIASFANALGGTIIVGVKDDKNDKPCPPFSGIAYHEKIRNTIEDIIQVYIDPIVFVDINTCISKDGQRMFVVIDIPQSNLTPHLVGALKRPYIRTGQSSRPEVLVHPSTLPWLLDHRTKSERLRHILCDKADSHFENYLQAHSLSSSSAVAALSLVPLYPQETLLDYKQIPACIEHCLHTRLADATWRLQPVQDGAAVIHSGSSCRMLEFNAYGLLTAKWLCTTDSMQNGRPMPTLHFTELARNVVYFFHTAQRFFEKIAFGGPLDFRLKITHTSGLRACLQAYQAQVLEDYVRLDKNYNLTELKAHLPHLLQPILQTAAWSLGLQLPDAEIKMLIEQCLQEIAHDATKIL